MTFRQPQGVESQAASWLSASMCNRYTPARAADIRAGLPAPIEEIFAPMPAFGTVGPFAAAPFVRPKGSAYQEVLGQWGMIRPSAKERRSTAKDKRPVLTNNARSETMAKLPTYRDAWANGQRCIIPAWGYDEPNWETGKNVWWTMHRADGQAWGIAGLWSTWVDAATGEVVESFTMPTINVDGHPLLSRLHKPEPDLPVNQQDKRAIVVLQPESWSQWLHGSEAEARALLQPLAAEFFEVRPEKASQPTLF